MGQNQSTPSNGFKKKVTNMFGNASAAPPPAAVVVYRGRASSVGGRRPNTVYGETRHRSGSGTREHRRSSFPEQWDLDRSPPTSGHMRMNDVNMPSGTKVSIVIPSKSHCGCSTPFGNVKLITLNAHGPVSGREYKIVADEMHKTLQFHNYKSYSIKKIQKVRNCCLWSNFRRREKQIAKEAGYVNERMLFHGSPSAETIATYGFDISKAKGGLFGVGVYFAQHSSKSNQYAAGYLGYRKMLFCRVALGKMHRLVNADSTLTRPPKGCHSVEGKLQVPEYIVYHNDQAYPEYLVEYDIVL